MTRDYYLLEDGAVVLVAPDQDLGNGAQRLDKKVLVVLRHRLVLVQNAEKVPTEDRDILCDQ